MASRARVARWATERAANKLANRGDTHFAADRRLYAKQLSELRREWKSEELLQRRQAYVAQREQVQMQEKSREKREAQEARRLNSDAVRTQREERAAGLAVWREREQKRMANEVKVGQKALAEKRAVEDEFRRKWLEGVLADYDVEGSQPTATFGSDRKRTWINPENFDRRLPQLMLRSESPVDMWNSLARKLQSEEEREAITERVGGRMLHPPPDMLTGVQGGEGGSTERLAERVRSMSKGGALLPSSEAPVDTPSGAPAGDVADAAGGAAGGGKSAGSGRDVAFLESLKQTIAGLDSVSDAKVSDAKEAPAGSTGEADGGENGGKKS